jgi:predicted N-formylglutamate amidohydrolase
MTRPAAEGLLGPDDKPPFEIVNAKGAAPLLIVCDHASRSVPASLNQLGLADALLMRHIGWDIGAAEVTRHLARRFDAPAVLSGYSRLVVDCNRRLDTPGAMPEASDGVEVPGNRGLSPSQREARAQALYRPYHAAIAERLADFARRRVSPAILSVHSFTPVMDGFVRPWHVGVLWDKDPRLPVPLIENLNGPGRIIGDNQPYSAREPAGYTMLAHAEPVGLPHALLEIRQDLIDTADGAAGWAAIIADALAPILAQTELYRAEHFR